MMIYCFLKLARQPALWINSNSLDLGFYIGNEVSPMKVLVITMTENTYSTFELTVNGDNYEIKKDGVSIYTNTDSS